MTTMRTSLLTFTLTLLLGAVLVPLSTFAQGKNENGGFIDPVKPEPQQGAVEADEAPKNTATDQPAQTPTGAQTAQPAEAPKTTTPTADTDTQGNKSGEFIPLTQLPAIKDAASSDTFPSFLNQMYKILIGIGAVLAVLMIMYAGVEFMMAKGSVGGNEKAKSRIQNAIFGLVLLLAPTIVFSIINPDILDLNLDVTSLQPDKLSPVDTSGQTPGKFIGGDAVLWTNQNGTKAVDAQRCSNSGGDIQYRCYKKDNSSYSTVTASTQCAAGETSANTCSAKGTVPTTGTECQAQYTEIRSVAIVTNGNSYNECSATSGFVAVPHGCCTGAAAVGHLCCAKPIKK